MRPSSRFAGCCISANGRPLPFVSFRIHPGSHPCPQRESGGRMGSRCHIHVPMQLEPLAQFSKHKRSSR